MKKLLLVLSLALALVLFAAACGGDDDDESSTDTTEAPDEGAAEDGAEDIEGDVDAGEEIYAATCASCHGADAEGVEGVGKPLAGSAYVAEISSGDLVILVTDGRPADHPDNTTGILMPPKGGNPALTDEDIVNVVAYIKSLN